MVESVPLFELHVGRVAAFDARRGLGTVTEDDGTVYDFHATAIADGSRTIEPGAVVRYLVRPGHLGRDEARELSTGWHSGG